MSIELKQAAQDAAEAIDWLLKNIRLEAPQLSGKAMGNAEKCASALRTALSQQPDNAACRSVQKRLAAQQPTQATQSTPSIPSDGPSTYAQRFTAAVAVICGVTPPVALVCDWINKEERHDDLQQWVGSYAPGWVQNIAVLDAAHQMADQPTEGGNHEPAQQPATAIACGIPGMAKTTCPYCEQGFAFEYEQPATPESVEDGIRNAEDELNCAEEVLDAITCEFSDGEFPVTDFNCICDYITAVVDVFKERLAAQQPATGEPVAALVRSRRIRTPAHCAFDKKDHYSEWSDWEPCTLSYARAVTDPARDKGLLPLYEMLPLCIHQAPSVPADVVRDAERYRWLRDHDHWPAPFSSSQEPEPVRGRDLDAAIDAARLAAK